MNFKDEEEEEEVVKKVLNDEEDGWCEATRIPFNIIKMHLSQIK